jgi:hypothetical protein
LRIFRPPHSEKSGFSGWKLDACPPWISCQYLSCRNHFRMLMYLLDIRKVLLLGLRLS